VTINATSNTPTALGRSGGTRVLGSHALSQISTRIEMETVRVRSTDIPLAIGDATAARARLGWAPRIAWERTLTDVLADWRSRASAD
jgi:GDP-D-mannose dehydratase